MVTASGEALIRVPLKNLAAQLDPAQFTQIHRAAIVNLQAVDRIERQGAGLQIHPRGRRETLAVSEAYARQFRQM